MGRIVSSFSISVDGVVEAPETWQFRYYDEQMQDAIRGSTSAAAFLMGRKLYELWSVYWPGAQRAEPDHVHGAAAEFAEFINRVPKYVVSTTLRDPAWANTSVLDGGVAEVEALRHRIAGDIVMAGSATLVRSLLASNLVDELRLLVHPIVVGRGARLFADGDTHSLRLVRSDVFPSGVLSLAYAPEYDV